MFAGRQAEMSMLAGAVTEIRRTGRGVMLSMRGRRQVGKSRLVEEFSNRSGLRSVSYTAVRRQDPDRALAEFAEAAAVGLGIESLVTGAASWEQALDLATTGDGSDPIIIVIDELPWLIEANPAIEGHLQRIWDRVLSRRRVLVILVGSDLAMMDALSAHGRPLYDRARPLVVNPLDPAAIAELIDAAPDVVLEAAAITGGFPNVVLRWQNGESPSDFLRRELLDPLSALVVSGERAVVAEFPPDAYARPVLDAIGVGEREHTTVSRRARLSGSALERALGQLLEKRVIVRERAYSTAASKVTSYRVADAYLRFWMRYIPRSLPMIERGAGERAANWVVEDWARWRGLAVEPIIRESVLRHIIQQGLIDEAAAVGHWWRRDHSTEVDIVIGDREGVARSVGAIGSIKWRDSAPFDFDDIASLRAARGVVPGTSPSTMTIAVSRTPVDATGVDVVLRPVDLLDAWR